ncbi:hypothetical protein SE959_09405 [Escherichia coli]|nr:hypothetical protein [Escherichia coli]
MLLNRVRCEAMEKYGSILTGICVDSSPKESIFLICDTLLSFHNKNAATNLRIFNIIVAGDFFRRLFVRSGRESLVIEK